MLKFGKIVLLLFNPGIQKSSELGSMPLSVPKMQFYDNNKQYDNDKKIYNIQTIVKNTMQ